METATKQLKQLLADNPIVYAPGVWDGLSATLAEGAGFAALCSSGFAISASLGMPDAELYTATENLQRVREITASSSLPVISDIDTGYGNAVNVMRTVREFEKAGVAAVFMEDQLAPKRCPICVGDPVPIIPREEAVGKIKAAVDARADENFLVIARLDSSGEEALERSEIYAEAGADMLMPVSKTFTSLDGWTECHERANLPLVVSLTANTWVEQQFTEDRMKDAGIKIAFLPTQILYAAVTGMRRALERLRKGEPPGEVTIDHITHAEFIKIIGFPEVEMLQERYLPPDPQVNA